jgi:sugar/nucleoside kinase (ribokinase family)
VALVGPDGERTFVTDRGAADHLLPSDLRPTWFRGAAALHLPAYSLYNEPLGSAARRAVELARSAGAILSVDLASQQPILDLGPAEAWERLAAVAPDVIFGNESEAEAILDDRPELDLLGLAPVVVLKRGGAGCRILGRRDLASPLIEIDVATGSIAASDTTGAGDAFAAGFLVRWLAPDLDRAATPASLGRAAGAGHRSAARLLTSPRQSIID